MKSEDQDPLMVRFFTEVGIIEQLVRARLENDLPGGLKVSQFSLLNHLVRLEGKWNPARLASAFQVTKAAMTNTLNRLESRGLVSIEADPADGRGKLVSLTPSGRDMREQCIASIAPFLQDLHQQFGEPGFESCLPFLSELRQYLDQNR